MADKTVFTVGFELPTEKFEYVAINSNRTLADADIILIKTILPFKEFDKCREFLNHWHNEILTAFHSGKTIFLYLPEKNTIKNAWDGMKVNNFDILPVRNKESSNKQGKKVKFTKDGNILKSYWELVGLMSNYKVTFDFNITSLLKTNDNSATVGACLQDIGTMLFLPPIELPKDFKLMTWSDESMKFGHNLFKEILAIDKAVKSIGEHTAPPEWINTPKFLLDKEEECITKIRANEEAIQRLQDEIITYEQELAEARIPKHLLYETGKALEKAIIHGLRILGFEADNYQDEESEFDIVFKSSDEGRFLGESEGKDSKAIAVEKARQLEINIQEDFAKDGVEEYAKGVLFGNGYRLIEPSERAEGFTTKVQTLADRSGITLVNTHEFFKIVKYLQNTDNQDYAKTIRECFRDTRGEIIMFPSIPTS